MISEISAKSKTAKYVGYFVLLSVLLFAVYLVFKDLSWCCGDNAQLSSILFEKTILFGWSGHGRFWPLGLFDYNILRFLPEFRSPVPCYLYNVVVLAISLCLWYKALNIVDKNNYLLSVFGLLVLSCSTAFFQVHMDCIFPEHFMFLTLSLFLLFYLEGLRTQKTKYYVIAIISAIYTTYCKEPAFVIFLIISGTNLIFGRELTKKDKIFNLFLLVNSIIYILIYVCLCYFSDNFLESVYGACVKNCDPLLKEKTLFNSPTTLLYVLELFIEKVEPISGILFLLGLIRAYFVLVKSERENVCFDALLFGANGYAVSYVLMFLPNTWYLFPEMVLGIPILTYWIGKNKKASAFLTLSIAISAYFSLNISKGIIERKLRERRRCQQFFGAIVSEYYKGRDLIFFGNKGYAFNGINFCLNTSMSSEMNILKNEQQIENISGNALVFAPKSDVKLNSALKNSGFSLIKTFWMINLFFKKTRPIF